MSKHSKKNEFKNSVNYKQIGEFNPELQSRELTISFSVQGSKTPQGEWKTQTTTIEQLSTWLSEFGIGEKDGSAILQGVVKDGVRKNETIIQNDLLILDYDSGHEIKEFVSKIQKKGLAALLWTTHSHGVSETQISKKSIQQLFNANGKIDLDSVKNYFRDQKGWHPTIIDSLVVLPSSVKSTADDLIINHLPIPKFRVMFFLKDQFLFDGKKTIRSSQLNLWKDCYLSFARSFSIPFDQSCSDASRLMYTPRMPSGAEGHQFIRIGGTALDLNSYRSNDIKRPFTVSHEKQKGTDIKTPNLETFFKRNSKRFEVVDFIKSLDESLIRNEKTNGLVEIECPYDHLHSNPGDETDRASYAVNSSDDESKNYNLGCHHNGCSDFKKVNFIDELCQKYDVNTEYLKTFITSPKILDTGETEADILNRIKLVNSQSTSEDISELCDYLARFTDLISAERGLKELSKHSAVSISILRSKLTNTKKTLENNSLVKSETDENQRTIIAQSMDFSEQVTRTADSIEQYNENEPRIFFMGDGRRVRIYQHKNISRVETLDSKGLSAELNKIIKCIKKQSNESTQLEVAPFRDLVFHIEGMSPSPFLPLESIIRVPVFSKVGRLRTERGYDRELSCFIDCDFIPLPVPEIPAQAELVEAKNWLYEVIFDFPFSDRFDGTEMQELKIDDSLNLERGQSSRTAAIALILQPFIRSLFSGSAPGFCIDKPVAGTGAGLFVDTMSLIAEGHRANATPVGPNNEELRKLITSALMNCQGLIFLDNINHHMDSGPLASALTSGIWQDRILGSSEMTNIETKATWVFAANNGSFSHELMRRFVPIRLDAGLPDPTRGREFRHPNLEQWILNNRQKIVWACHIIIQNWIAKGKPKGKANLASFEDWSSVMSGILEAAHINHFMENIQYYMNSRDMGEDDKQSFIQAWWDKKHDKIVTTKELFNEVCNFGSCSNFDLPIDHPDPNQQKKKLGHYISSHVVGNTFTINETNVPGSIKLSEKNTLRCQQCGLSNGVKTWKLVQVK